MTSSCTEPKDRWHRYARAAELCRELRGYGWPGLATLYEALSRGESVKPSRLKFSDVPVTKELLELRKIAHSYTTYGFVEATGAMKVLDRLTRNGTADPVPSSPRQQRKVLLCDTLALKLRSA